MLELPLTGQTVRFKSAPVYKEELGDTWHDEEMLVMSRKFVGYGQYQLILIPDSMLVEFYEFWEVNGDVGTTEDICHHFHLSTHHKLMIEPVVDNFEVGKLAYVAKTKELVTIRERDSITGTGLYVRYSPIDKNSPVSDDDMNIYGEHDPDGTLSAIHYLRPIK